VSKGIGQLQMRILQALIDGGGVLRIKGILERLFAGAGYNNKAYAGLSRSLKGLRCRRLVQTYKGVSVAGRATVIAALTTDGKKAAQGIVWEGEDEPEPGQP
jgi:hypothetical protein